MIWAHIFRPNKNYATTVASPFNITLAVLDVDETPGTSDVRLILKKDQIDYILCNLNKTARVQVPLDLHFSEGDEIAFRSDGGTIHLTGYYEDEYDFEAVLENESDEGEPMNIPDGVSTDEETSDEETPDSTPITSRPTSIPTGGIIIAEIVKGDGTEATMGKRVRIYRECINVSSSTNSLGQFFDSIIGAGDEEQRWLKGVEGMRVGGKRKIFCENGPRPAETYIVDLISVL